VVGGKVLAFGAGFPSRQHLAGGLQVFRRQRWFLSLLGILIILPSMYMAYQSIRNNLEQAQVKSYIESNFQQGNPQVVAFHLTPAEKELALTIIGRTITAVEQTEL
jgi:hypothetical protein